jgi:hypothetical protein
MTNRKIEYRGPDVVTKVFSRDEICTVLDEKYCSRKTTPTNIKPCVTQRILLLAQKVSHGIFARKIFQISDQRTPVEDIEGWC